MSESARVELPETYFFDLDGTLTDPFSGITKCIRFALQQLGAEVPEATDLAWCIGPPLRDSFVQMVGDSLADQALALYRERFAEVGLFENSKYSDVDELLNNIKGLKASCYVASSKPEVYVERILERFELRGFFQQVFGSELSGARSDKTELLAYALAETGANPQRSVMLGDRKHDAIGALNNGVRPWGAGWGYGSAEELNGAGVELVFGSVREMIGAVNR